MWILRYFRYGALNEYEGDTKEDVLSFGVYGSEEGNLSMYELIDPDGNVCMNQEELKNYWFEYQF